MQILVIHKLLKSVDYNPVYWEDLKFEFSKFNGKISKQNLTIRKKNIKKKRSIKKIKMKKKIRNLKSQTLNSDGLKKN